MNETQLRELNPESHLRAVAIPPVHQSARISMLSVRLVKARQRPLSQSMTALNAAVSSGEPQQLNPWDPRVPRPPQNTEA